MKVGNCLIVLFNSQTKGERKDKKTKDKRQKIKVKFRDVFSGFTNNAYSITKGKN